MACWGVNRSTWKTPLAPVTNDYIPVGAPAQSQVSSALTCDTSLLGPDDDCASLVEQQTKDLIQSLTNQSILATQAANLLQVQTDNPNPVVGCDATSDLFGCLGNLAWYWWAAIAAGGLAVVLAVKK